MTATPKLDGTGWMLIAILPILWGGSFVMIEIGLPRYPPLTLVFARVAFSVPPIVLSILLRG